MESFQFTHHFGRGGGFLIAQHYGFDIYLAKFISLSSLKQSLSRFFDKSRNGLYSKSENLFSLDSLNNFSDILF